MLWRLALVLGLALAASAAGAKPCLPPSDGTPVTLQGRNYIEGYEPTAHGTWRAIWCPTGRFSPITGTEIWQLYTHAVLDKYATVSARSVINGALLILKTPDPLAELDAVLKSGEFIPPAGTQDRYDWEATLYAGCVEGERLGPSGTPVNGTSCTPPTPLPVTVVQVWRVTASGSTLFPYSAGKLGAPIAGRRAPGGATCDHSKPAVKVGSATYLPLVGAPANEYAACQKVN